MKKVGTLINYMRTISDRTNTHWIPSIIEVRNPAGDPFPDDALQKQKAAHAWFRGQSKDDSLRPRVYRDRYIETELALRFRRRARGVAAALERVPERNEFDEWLFLMQHYGTPTRLLDWTESALLRTFQIQRVPSVQPTAPIQAGRLDDKSSRDELDVLRFLNPNAQRAR